MTSGRSLSSARSAKPVPPDSDWPAPLSSYWGCQVNSWSVVALQSVAPPLNKEASDEGGFRGAFVEDFMLGPTAELGEQRGGFRAGFHGIEFGARLGAE